MLVPIGNHGNHGNHGNTMWVAVVYKVHRRRVDTQDTNVRLYVYTVGAYSMDTQDGTHKTVHRYTHTVHTHTGRCVSFSLLTSAASPVGGSPWEGAPLVPARRPQRPPSQAPRGRPHLPPRRKERPASYGPRSGGGPRRPPPGRHTAAGHSTVPVEVDGATVYTHASRLKPNACTVLEYTWKT